MYFSWIESIMYMFSKDFNWKDIFLWLLVLKGFVILLIFDIIGL